MNIQHVWWRGIERTAFVGAAENCWRDRTYCSHRGIDERFRSLQKQSAWFHINFSSAHMVKIISRNSRKLSRSMEDFGVQDEIAPSDSGPRFIVVSQLKFLLLKLDEVLVIRWTFKGLLTWRWGTPSSWGNPPSRGRKIKRVYMQSYNLGVLGWGFLRLLLRLQLGSFSIGVPSSHLEKDERFILGHICIYSWKRHALCCAVLGYARNRRLNAL